MSEHEFDAEQARRDLYEVMSRDTDFDTKATDALRLGRKYLGVQNGHLTRIDEPIDYREVIASSDPSDGVITPGLVMDLQKTFCREAIQREDPLRIHDVDAQGWGGHPARTDYGIQCYHGTTITVDDELYGTVCFGSITPREDPFTEDETLYAELIGRMLEHELVRERTETELEQLERFASVVSHDLRNPMTVAKNRIELEREHRDSEHLESAATAVDRMDDIVDDVLTVVRQGRDVEDTEPVTLESQLSSCRQSVDLRDATVTVTEDIEFAADPDRLRQLFENLLRNALDHAGEGVTVTVGSLRAPDGFYVEDDGPGIPGEDRETVFESGYSTREEGTGLGLSIVASIVESHDWEIEVTESEQGGARFEITGVAVPQ
ncbi:histidine kinase [Halorientalis sp. IM1011]|uniref:sensor histidine kinase n=1 Tax=Halorientalis sp. IM1011 TaxID=1932360 RepID=UPI00097CD4A9|nr:GAF domain-containing sensor histidine kinase [Halorientalis sp. IM1011]AQL41822.1 histidine kinase [Halorientalis sp. IM1011]